MLSFLIYVLKFTIGIRLENQSLYQLILLKPCTIWRKLLRIITKGFRFGCKISMAISLMIEIYVQIYLRRWIIILNLLNNRLYINLFCLFFTALLFLWDLWLCLQTTSIIICLTNSCWRFSIMKIRTNEISASLVLSWIIGN